MAPEVCGAREGCGSITWACRTSSTTGGSKPRRSEKTSDPMGLQVYFYLASNATTALEFRGEKTRKERGLKYLLPTNYNDAFTIFSRASTGALRFQIDAPARQISEPWPFPRQRALDWRKIGKDGGVRPSRLGVHPYPLVHDRAIVDNLHQKISFTDSRRRKPRKQKGWGRFVQPCRGSSEPVACRRGGRICEDTAWRSFPENQHHARLARTKTFRYVRSGGQITAPFPKRHAESIAPRPAPEK